MSYPAPQGKRLDILPTTGGVAPAAYAVAADMDISPTGSDFISHGMEVLNFDTIAVLFISYDGINDHETIDPAILTGRVWDNFYPAIGTKAGTIKGKVWFRSSSAGSLYEAHLWG